MARGGYAWWYLDALSDDGQCALTVIALIGNVFSPYYFRARARGAADPANFCAMNVALYHRNGSHWAMTERPREALRAEPCALSIGPSAFSWNGAGLTVDIAEITCPSLRRLRGRIRLLPDAPCTHRVELDAAGLHTWAPIAPCGRVEVEFERPAWRWSGSGYLDSNEGREPVENAFSSWTWSRAPRRPGTVVVYDVGHRGGSARGFATLFKRNGGVEPLELPAPASLRTTRWGLRQGTRSETDGAKMVRALEDGPFYARSVIETTLLGERGEAVHETLSLDRFRRGWVRMLLPFRMPRRL